MKNISKLNEKLVKSLNAHLESGYEKDKVQVNRIIDAIKNGKISIGRDEDDHCSFDDLAGDCFNPDANPDIDPAKLKREENAYKAKIRRSGVWGYRSSYWTGRSWEDSEGLEHSAICGFVGFEFFGSGYELQVMEEALDAYNRQQLDADGFVIDPFRMAS